MAAGTIQLFDQTAKTILGSTDLLASTIKIALVGAGYTPNQDTHTIWADASGSEITGGGTTGYTAGGYTLLSPALTEITKGYKFSSANPTWTAGADTLGTWKYMVAYLSGTFNSVTNPLLFYCEGESGSTVPATTSGNTLTITCPAGGWFDVTRP